MVNVELVLPVKDEQPRVGESTILMPWNKLTSSLKLMTIAYYVTVPA